MSKTEVLSATHGIAPRSNELHILGTDVAKGRASQESWDEQIATETAAWLELQNEAGIDLPEDGKLHWQDHLRPLVKSSKGFTGEADTNPVTRWFETNRFYRKPTIQGDLEFNFDRFTELYGKPGKHISLLSPYAFLYLCDWDLPQTEQTATVLDFYQQIIGSLVSNGVQRITLEGYGFNGGVSADYNQELASINPDAQFTSLNHETATVVPSTGSVNLGFDLTKHVGYIDTEPKSYTVQGETITLQPPDYSTKELWISVIEASNTDTSGNIEEAKLCLRKFRPAKLVITHDTDLEQVPLKYAQEKVKQLGGFAAELSEYVETKL